MFNNSENLKTIYVPAYEEGQETFYLVNIVNLKENMCGTSFA